MPYAVIEKKLKAIPEQFLYVCRKHAGSAMFCCATDYGSRPSDATYIQS